VARSTRSSTSPRAGLAIAHLCCVLVNEFVLISAGQAVADPFTTPQFHDLFDGALRAPRP
jgi:hypothetical protein